MPRAVHFFFFFNDTATTEIYTLSLHDALPIFAPNRVRHGLGAHLDHHHPIEVRRRDLPQEPLDELPEVIEPHRQYVGSGEWYPTVCTPPTACIHRYHSPLPTPVRP